MRGDPREKRVQYSELKIDALLLPLTTFSARNHALNLSSSSPRGPLCRVLISTRRSSDSRVQEVQYSELRIDALLLLLFTDLLPSKACAYLVQLVAERAALSRRHPYTPIEPL